MVFHSKFGPLSGHAMFGCSVDRWALNLDTHYMVIQEIYGPDQEPF